MELLTGNGVSRDREDELYHDPVESRQSCMHAPG